MEGAEMLSAHRQHLFQPHITCKCLHDSTALAAGIPSSGTVAFENIINTWQQVAQLWERVNCCEWCVVDRQMVGLLSNIAESILALFQAANLAYGLEVKDKDVSGAGLEQFGLDYQTLFLSMTYPPAKASSTPSEPIICERCPMTLGILILDDDEAALLAKQMVCKSLVDLSYFLQTLRNAARETSATTLGQAQTTMSRPFHVPGESEMLVNRILSRVLSLLGRLRAEQN